MGVEIRQLVVKANLVQGSKREESREASQDLEAFKDEVLQECRRLIRRSREEEGER